MAKFPFSICIVYTLRSPVGDILQLDAASSTVKSLRKSHNNFNDTRPARREHDQRYLTQNHIAVVYHA